MQDFKGLSDYQYGFSKPENYVFKSKKGLNEKVVASISAHKNEPPWMREFRLKAYTIFLSKKMPNWGGKLSDIDFDDIYYYIKPIAKKTNRWEDLPVEIKDTYDRIGIPEAEKKYLAGVSAQYESEVVYKSIHKALSKQGVVFLDMDSGLREYPEIVKKYFSTIIPPRDNKFAALNSAVWSGGSFVYVPKGVKVELPLQAYFRINAANMGQFERTLIIAEEGSYVHYVEGCTAPVYSTDSLHSAVVEIIVKPRARVRYTTIQNWSSNVYNLVTKRAWVEEKGVMEWVDANLGCLTGDTTIFVQGDMVLLKDVQVGMYVYSLTSDLKIIKSKILAKKTNPPQNVFKITTEDFHEIEATDNHPFLTLTKKGKVSTLFWKQLSQIKKGDQIAVSGNLDWSGTPYAFSFTPKRGRKDFSHPSITNDDLLWFLGFYVGDGYMEKSRVYIAVPQTDKNFRKVFDLIRKMFGLTPGIKGNTIRYNCSKFVDFIKYLEFIGNARTKKIPPWVFTLPQSQITAFINGYIAADGYRRYNHKNVSITSVNKNLLQQIKMLAYLTDYQPRKISKWERREKKPLGKEAKTYSHYFLYFGDGQKTGPVQFVKVSDITSVGKKVTYDIEVENANFLANGFFVHNSKLTMKYPSVYLMGRGARGEVLSIAYAGAGQHQDAGGKAIHAAPYTSSQIISKSISKKGGRTSYRGLLKVYPGAHHVKSKVVCDALLLDPQSRSDTYPTIENDEQDVTIEHEATVSKVGDEQLFYLQSRGLSKELAESMVVNGFIEPIVKEIPLEYAVEMNRLIQLQMEGSVG